MGGTGEGGIVMRQARYIVLGIFVASVCGSVCGLARGQNPPPQPPAQQSSSQNSSSQQSSSQSSTAQQQAGQQQSQPGQQQQSLSLADAARKYREEKAEKEKNGSTPTKVYTNEGVLPNSGANALGIGPIPSTTHAIGGGTGRGGQGSASSQAEGMASLENAEAKLDTALNVIDALSVVDRETMVNTILKGDTADFPGRKQWEDRLMAGRDYYVVHGRQLIQGMKQLLANMKALALAEPNVSENDPRVLSFMRKVQAGYTDAQKTADDFKRLVEEGPALAKQARKN